MRPIQLHPLSLLAGVLLIGTAGFLTSMQQISPQHALLLSLEQKEMLDHMSIVYLANDKTLRIEGVNLQIVNGLNATNGYPRNPDSLDPTLTRVNGVGNLIIGYNELGNPYADSRTGSHNIIVGHGHSYVSFGGAVIGRDGTSSGAYSTVTGGDANRASGNFASVSGGCNGQAGGTGASVVGGSYNGAAGMCATVTAGSENSAIADYSAVHGGRCSFTHGMASAIGAGLNNSTSGQGSWIAGGQSNHTAGFASVISGGIVNSADGNSASVTGGEGNQANGDFSSVSGGLNRSTAATHNWAAGSLVENN